jgi:predicted ATP-grasp superfamily ATP-dependent carboligase
LHPNDLKPAVARVLNEMLEPVRQHFATNADAKKLLEQVKKYQADLKKKAEQEEKQNEGKQDKDTTSSS